MTKHEEIIQEEGKMDHHENHQQEINAQWEKSQKNIVIEKIKAGERTQEIFESLKGFKEAFLKKLDIMACSDERVQVGEEIIEKIPEAEGAKAGFAGQLNFLSEAELLEFVDRCLWHFKGLTSHYNCGAALAKFREILASGDIPTDVTSGDELGVWHTERLVRLMNNHRKMKDLKRAEKEKVVHLFIEQSEMTGDLHNARGICFDGTGRFNPAVIEDMPATYVSSSPGFGLSQKYCMEELNMLTGIAMGNHAFGDRFTAEEPKDPFYIFVSAYDEERLSELKDWAREAIAEYGGRVEVKGFIAPKPEELKAE